PTASPAISTLSLHDALPIFGDPLHEIRAIHVEGNLADDELLAAALDLLHADATAAAHLPATGLEVLPDARDALQQTAGREVGPQDRKSTRLNSSHVKISYAV